jgi:tetratricopeptide (TPR) repeat protein
MQITVVCLLFAAGAAQGQDSASTRARMIDHLREVVAACRNDCSMPWKELADRQLAAGDAAGAHVSVRNALVLLQGDSTSMKYAAVTSTLGLVEFAHRQYARAERAWMRSLNTLQQHVSESDPAVAAIWAQLALVRTIQQKYGEAERLFMRAIDVTGQRAEAIEYHDRLARTYQLAGRHRDAEQRARIGLELASRITGLENAGALPLRVSLGSALASQRRHAEADAVFQEALALAEKLYGTQHLFTGSILGEYARALQKAGRKREAKQISQAARSILSRHNHHLSTVDIKELDGW